MPFPPEQRPTWVDIDLAAFERNVDAIAAGLRPGVRLMALLKADAYGHGAVELARHCHPEKVAMIGVALLEEGLELRDAGIELPILVLGPLNDVQVRIALDRGLTLGVPGPEELALVAEVARDRDVAIHLKLDSGMGRMGCIESDLPRVIEILRGAPRLTLDAIYTHFANASDIDDPKTGEQLERFERMLETLMDAGVSAPHHHAANSAATMRGIVPGDFARTGVSLYGAVSLDLGGRRFEPVMRWRTEISRLKVIEAGESVGYAARWRAVRPSRIATLPVGYADGYARILSNRGEVLVRGMRVRVIGRISMDLVTIDVTEVPGVSLGDEVVLLGRQGDEEISAEELAGKLDTISYEVFCNVGARVPRVYRHGASVAAIRTRFPA
jgi:alanine racemase